MSEDMKTFYRMRLCPYEEGLGVDTEEWYSIHETECFYHCVPWWNKSMTLEGARKNKKRLKRIAKNCSRFAFETKEEAMEHLKFIKRKQLRHMEREKAFIRAFLAAETLENDGNLKLVPDSKDLVAEFLHFD